MSDAPDSSTNPVESDSAGSDDRDSSTVDLTPEKTGLLDTLPADLGVIGAVKELIDNSLDAWERESPPLEHLEIKLEYDEDEDVLIVRDNAGGVPSNDVRAFFTLGMSNPGDGMQTRGAYGVGTKKASLRLADEITFATRHYTSGDDEPGAGFTITSDWLEKDGTWQIEEEQHDIPKGTTEIRLKNLKFDWEETEVRLREELRSAYRRQLGGGPFNEPKMADIQVNGSKLSPPDSIKFGFPALDGLHPREFKKEVSHPELDEPMTIRVAVGLRSEKKQGEFGTDLYVQGRLVHEKNTGKQGGFDAPNGLGSFSDSRHGRFRAALSIESEAPAEQLPWNTTKDKLHPNNPVMKDVWEFFRKTCDRYFGAVSTTLKQVFLRFPADHEWAYNDGKVEDAGDYTDRKRVTDKPEKGYPECSELREQAEAHATLGIFYPDGVIDKDDEVKRQQKLEIYQKLVEEEFESVGDQTTPHELKGIAPDFTEYDVDAEEIRSSLKDEAEEHAREGMRYTGHESWQQPLYDAFLEKYASDGRGSLTATSDRDDLVEDDEDDEDDETETTGDKDDIDTDNEDPSGGDDEVTGNGDEEEREEKVETRELTLSVTAEELETLREQFGDLDRMDPEERGERFVEFAERLQDLMPSA